MKTSIITTSYNSGNTIRDTIESVLRQTYPDIEYIIVDGASKDNTLDIIEEFVPKFDGKLKYISEPDKGIYDAMNKGLAMATGDVVGILNSDDFYTSNDILERVAAELKQNPDIDAVYGDIHFVKDGELDKCVRYYTSKYFRRWQMRLGFMPAHPSFYCRRSIYDKFGVFNSAYRVSADFELLLRFIFIHDINIKYLPLDFVTMRSGGASTSGIGSHRQILKDHRRAYRENGVYSNLVYEGIRYAYKLVEVSAYRLRSLFR